MMIDRRYFLPDHLPRSLPHRDAEQKDFAEALRPAIEGHRADDVLLSGPSGVGKTVLARCMVNKLQHHTGAHFDRIRCVPMTDASILYKAIADHPRDTAVHRNTPKDELLETLQEIVSIPYILVLDEADDLPRLDLLADLYRVPKLSIVAICHDPEEWRSRAQQTIGERFTMTNIHLDTYDTDELLDILAPRVEHGLEEDVVTDAQLQRIAKSVDGTARFAITALQAAAELADERNHDSIHDADVDDSFELAREKMRLEQLRSLSLGHHVVYEIIRHGSGLTGAEIDERYEAIAGDVYTERDQEPVSERQLQNYRTKLLEYDLIDYNGSNRWRRYYAADEEIEAPINIPATLLT